MIVRKTLAQLKGRGVIDSRPLLGVERTTSDTLGRNVLRSRALYNPLLTELVAELPPALDDTKPAGLRLTYRSATD